MPSAPYSLLIDVGAPRSIIKSGTTVTVTTANTTPIVTGAYVQVGISDESALGSAVTGVFQVTAVSGTVFTFTASGTAAGTVSSQVTGDGILSMDFLSPPTNYSGTPRLNAPYVEIESLQMSASGDGSSDTMAVAILQDVTPSIGPWFSRIPDDARVRLIKVETGSTPSTAYSDVLFHGIITSVSAELNESGQGSIADVSMEDVNIILDKISVAGQGSVDPLQNIVSVSRSSGTVTITLQDGDRTNWYSGLPVTVSGVIGGNGTSWNGNFTVSSIGTASNPTYGEPKIVSVKYLQAGSDDSTAFQQAISSIARYSRSTNQVLVTISSGHGLSNPVACWIQAVTQTSGDGTLQNLVNSQYPSSSMKILNSTQLIITLSRAVTSWHNFVNGNISSLENRFLPAQANDGPSVVIPAGKTEDEAVAFILGKVDRAKGGDRYIQAIFNTSSTGSIVGGTVSNAIPINLPAGSLRSMLDAVIEAYAGSDSKARRYFIGLNRRLNYKLIDEASKPTYATSPYSLTTQSIGDPNTTTAKATLAPFSLRVSYEHNTTKGAVFNTTASDKLIVSYLTARATGFSNRAGAVYDESVDFASPVTSGVEAATQRFAKSFFLERQSPLLVGSCELRGAGTATHNNLGFSAGYAQTGTASFGLVSRWAPGQWCEVVAPSLNLNGLYTVESVNMTFEPGSYTQIISIGFNRKSPSTIAKAVSKSKR